MYYFYRVGDYKLIYGRPGVYNDWYQIPKGDGFCPIYDATDDSEIFIYDSLNHMARRVRSERLSNLEASSFFHLALFVSVFGKTQKQKTLSICF